EKAHEVVRARPFPPTIPDLQLIITPVKYAGDICVDHVPPGAWAVGVSGGGDSVALLELLRGRGDLSLHVAHLEHETPAGGSVHGVTIVRPLLGVRRETLRELLRDRGIAWREDASNASPAQQRNRVRATLARHPKLTASAIDLAAACAALVNWLREAAPDLPD